ncbi:MAG: hypothetical protein FWF75_00040 [Propionibacteriaceae bacterium]|nr:hypothetical protein [Propionibacteriaceae bacterium]
MKRRVLVSVAVLLAAVLIGVFVVIHIQRPGGDVRPYPPGLLGEFSGLRDDQTGLFRDPNSSTVGPLDSLDSVYAQAVLKAAGAPPLRPSQASIAAAMTATIDNPVYQAWATAQLTGRATLTADAAVTAVGAAPQDTPDRIGYLVIVVEAWCAATRPCPTFPQATTVMSYLNSPSVMAARAASPYLDVRSQVAAALLGATLSPVDVHYTLPSRIAQAMDVLNLYGLTCQAVQGEADIDRQAIASLLRPFLEAPLAGNMLEASFAAQAWVLLGQDLSALDPLVNQVKARIDPSTQLVHGYVAAQGDVHTTYEVARLVSQDFASIATQQTQQSLTAALTSSGPSSGADLQSELEAGCALAMMGKLSSDQHAKLVGAGDASLKQITVTVAAARSVQALADAMECLGAQVPPLIFAPSPASDMQTEFNALAMLDLAIESGQASQLVGYYSNMMDASPGDIRSYSGPMEYLVRWLPVLNTHSMTEESGVRMALQGVINDHLGCTGFPTLVQMSTAGEGCSLDVTRLLLDSGGTYEVATKDWVL